MLYVPGNKYDCLSRYNSATFKNNPLYVVTIFFYFTLYTFETRKLFCWKYIQSKYDLGEDTFVYFFHSVYEAMIYHDHMRISIQYTFEGTYMRRRRRRLCCILSYSTFGIQRILLHTMYVVYIWQVIDIKYICVEKIIHEILDWLAKPMGNNSKKSEWICNEGLVF